MNYRNVPDGEYSFSFAAVEGESVPPAPAPRKGGKTPWREVQRGREAPRYNIAAIRGLLLAAFTAGDLRRLVLYTAKPDLKPLTHEFSDSDGLSATVEKAITYCRKKDCIPDLLAEVKEANPRQYVRYEGDLLA